MPHACMSFLSDSDCAMKESSSDTAARNASRPLAARRRVAHAGIEEEEALEDDEEEDFEDEEVCERRADGPATAGYALVDRAAAGTAPVVLLTWATRRLLRMAETAALVCTRRATPLVACCSVVNMVSVLLDC
jgi:hypothetical protein